jgi:hypothetical protein
MHGGLPVIGISVLVYGAVGAVVIAREGLRRCRRGRRTGGIGAVGGERGVRTCPAASQ